MNCMTRFQMMIPVCAGLLLASCSSSPEEPVNQTLPIRTMDNFFRSLSPRPSPQPVYAQQPGHAPDYAREPGYAPAYPPLDP
jgi:hypothetical protein